MADIVDIGNDRAQELLDSAIAKARNGPKGQPGIGICLNCDLPLHDDRRWCSPECRDDWEKRTA